MFKSVYVGNLPFTASEDDVRELFSKHGPVRSVKMIADPDTGQPRGYCFVEMEHQGAYAAIDALNGKEFGGRNLRVNEARERRR